MIHSMTAFARFQHQGTWGSLVCEMRSINHRYLEISMHLPEIFRIFEMQIREKIRQSIKRGKVECTLRYQLNPDNSVSSFKVNQELAQALCIASEEIPAPNLCIQ